MSDSTTPPAPPDTSAGDGWALRQGDYIMWAVHPYDSYTKWERARFDHWAAGGHAVAYPFARHGHPTAIHVAKSQIRECHRWTGTRWVYIK